MSAILLKFALLAVGMLMLHDLGMSASGHASAVEAVAFSEVSIARSTTHSAETNHSSMPEECGSVRSFPQRQAEQEDENSFGSLLLPDPSTQSSFAAISRSSLTSPISHPPNRERAFFSVFRI